MCGVVAILDRAGPVDPARLDRALGLLAHRGPDDEGTALHWDGRLSLGHRRLVIFGSGSDGCQPMTDPVTGNTVIFNGAIYNHMELRAELGTLGHAFRGASDTEVILAAWRQWGPDAFPRFNGMWAIILLDAKADRLIVCRDRLGVKPLYVSDDGRQVVFASEARAVLAASGHAPVVDAHAVHDFLVLGLTDHSARSFFDGVVEVPAGALWTITRDGRIGRDRFHDWPEQPLARGISPDQLHALLADALRLRLRADVPAVALLSGGLDSSIVAWLATRAEMDRGALAGLLTYGYRESIAADETAAAARFGRSLGAIPHEVLRVPAVPDFADLTDVLRAQEQPFNTPSLVAAFRLYRLIRRRGSKVAITGEGADELFAGYTRRYAPLLARDALRRGRPGEALTMLRRGQVSARLLTNRAAWDLPAPMTRRLMRERPNGRAIARDFWHDSAERFEDLMADQRRPLPGRLHDDVTRSLLPFALRFADRNGMASGVEVRSPFLDYRVVEAALHLAPAAKIDIRGGKRILRQAFAAHLPPEIIDAPKTHGLGMAEQFQLGRMNLTPLFEAPPALAAQFLDLPALREALRRSPNNPTLWWPICLLQWLGWVEGGMV